MVRIVEIWNGRIFSTTLPAVLEEVLRYKLCFCPTSSQLGGRLRLTGLWVKQPPRSKHSHLPSSTLSRIIFHKSFPQLLWKPLSWKTLTHSNLGISKSDLQSFLYHGVRVSYNFHLNRLHCIAHWKHDKCYAYSSSLSSPPFFFFLLSSLYSSLLTIFLYYLCTILNTMALAWVIMRVLNNRNNDNVINTAGCLTLTAVFQISNL